MIHSALEKKSLFEDLAGRGGGRGEARERGAVECHAWIAARRIDLAGRLANFKRGVKWNSSLIISHQYQQKTPLSLQEQRVHVMWAGHRARRPEPHTMCRPRRSRVRALSGDGASDSQPWKSTRTIPTDARPRLHPPLCSLLPCSRA